MTTSTSEKTAGASKKRELLELKFRAKIADETFKKVGEERKELKARIGALTAEIKGGHEEAGAEG